MSHGRSQIKSLLKSALDMEEDFQFPPTSTINLPESTLTKSLLKSALDMEEDFQILTKSPNMSTNMSPNMTGQPNMSTSQPGPNLDLDYDFRMCNIVNPETARLRRSLPKTASLLRFLSHINLSHFNPYNSTIILLKTFNILIMKVIVIFISKICFPYL